MAGSTEPCRSSPLPRSISPALPEVTLLSHASATCSSSTYHVSKQCKCLGYSGEHNSQLPGIDILAGGQGEIYSVLPKNPMKTKMTIGW